MNKLTGKIVGTTINDHLIRVELEVVGEIFVAMLIAVPEINPSLTIGKTVNLVFKETDVSLSLKIPAATSIANILPISIHAKEEGVLLTRLTIDFKGILLNAVVPSNFGGQRKVGEQLFMLLRSNEIMLMDV